MIQSCCWAGHCPTHYTRYYISSMRSVNFWQRVQPTLEINAGYTRVTHYISNCVVNSEYTTGLSPKPVFCMLSCTLTFLSNRDVQPFKLRVFKGRLIPTAVRNNPECITNHRQPRPIKKPMNAPIFFVNWAVRIQLTSGLSQFKVVSVYVKLKMLAQIFPLGSVKWYLILLCSMSQNQDNTHSWKWHCEIQNYQQGCVTSVYLTIVIGAWKGNPVS